MFTLGDTGILRHRTDKIAFLCCKVGTPIKTWSKNLTFRTVMIYIFEHIVLSVVVYYLLCTSLSNLPGLRSAGSKLSGRLVAPTMRKWSDWFIPSMSVRSWATRRFSGAEEPVRLGHRESSSSKNSTHGPSSAAARARSNIPRNVSSLSPGRDPTTWNSHLLLTLTFTNPL